MPAVTVFGGSRVEPDSDEYLQAQSLGRALAERGFDVVTGGYNGVMEAVSRGEITPQEAEQLLAAPRHAAGAGGPV